VDAVAVIARTGFFVLCSVFKEHRAEKAKPELGALCADPGAQPEPCGGACSLLRSLLPAWKLLPGAESHPSGSSGGLQAGGSDPSWRSCAAGVAIRRAHLANRRGSVRQAVVAEATR